MRELGELLARTTVVASGMGSQMLNLDFLVAPGLMVLLLGENRWRPSNQSCEAAGHKIHPFRGWKRWPPPTRRLTPYDVKEFPVEASIRDLDDALDRLPRLNLATAHPTAGLTLSRPPSAT